MAEFRTRCWLSVIYPGESAPDNWQDILATTCVPALVSPLHDKDVNPDGEVKKAHRHVMLMYDGPKTKKQAQAVLDQIGGVGCIPANSVRGCARYLCHMDNPEKYQYSSADVISFAGVDYFDICTLASSKRGAIMEMQEWCDDHKCASMRQLMRYARYNRPDWFQLLCESCCMVMTAYLKSLQWELDKFGGLLEDADPDGIESAGKMDDG